MSSEDVIEVNGVSKSYLIYDKPEHRLKQMLFPHLRAMAGLTKRQYFREFPAVSNVSFTVGRGESIGIIGRNGSGKSTLLQMVCGTLQPSEGHVTVRGRIAALLELGSGFNPEFSGRENVLLNAAILGLCKEEISDRFNAIVEFSEIGGFIDQPVKTYSSGMYVRLAFAVAINIDPDILIIDEALSVGDEAFQRKCFARIENIRERGATILFVSHGAQTIIQLCDRAILMDRGEKILEGAPKEVVSQYQRFLNLSGLEAEAARQKIKSLTELEPSSSRPLAPVPESKPKPPVFANPTSWFDSELKSHSRTEYDSLDARIENVRILNEAGQKVNCLKSDERYTYSYRVTFLRNVKNVGFGMMIKTAQGLELGGAATDFEQDLKLANAEANSTYDVSFDLRWSLAQGTYFLNAGVSGSINDNQRYAHRILDAIAFKILPEPRRIITGTVNFDPAPMVKLVKAQELEAAKG